MSPKENEREDIQIRYVKKIENKTWRCPICGRLSNGRVRCGHCMVDIADMDKSERPFRITNGG